MFQVADILSFKRKLLHFASSYPVFTILDSNGFYDGKDLKSHPFYHSYELLAGLGARYWVKASSGSSFTQLENFNKAHPGWLFGCLGYDLKNEIEILHSEHPDHIGLPDLFFFVPETVVLIKDGQIKIQSVQYNASAVFEQITNFPDEPFVQQPFDVQFTARIRKEEYLENIQKIREHIAAGDVYELNYCQEFYSEGTRINPFALFEQLKHRSPQPFSALMRIEDRYVISASMERFLKKEGKKLISQPIKGTVRRGKTQTEDTLLKQQLRDDSKERAENVMIVDLVRNDLTRYAHTGSIQVEELFGIYEFPFVNHMISTVSSQLHESEAAIRALKAAFPMGSMTGAPKVMAMELIEKYERSRRGLYSGAIGYIDPEGDFDFNVVIRSFLYNETDRYLSLHVGSAITYDSIPEKEYEECMVKIEGLLRCFDARQKP